MEKSKRGLGSAARELDIAKAMRSRLSDTLVPPPAPQKAPRAMERRNDPKVVAERVWVKLMGEGSESDFEVRFTLNDGRSFALRGDKEGFASIQPLEPFEVSQDLLLLRYSDKVTKIELVSDEKCFTFAAYDDFIEWLELV